MALSAAKVEQAATGLASASQLTHFAGFRIATFFVKVDPDEVIKSKLGFREDARGANLWLVVRRARSVWVCDAGACVVLKALAVDRRSENKDTYDLFYVIRNYGTGVGEVTGKLRPLLDGNEAARAVDVLRRDFVDFESVGPRRVAEFITGGREDEIQADVVGFVSAVLNSIDR